MEKDTTETAHNIVLVLMGSGRAAHTRTIRRQTNYMPRRAFRIGNHISVRPNRTFPVRLTALLDHKDKVIQAMTDGVLSVKRNNQFLTVEDMLDLYGRHMPTKPPPPEPVEEFTEVAPVIGPVLAGNVEYEDLPLETDEQEPVLEPVQPAEILSEPVEDAIDVTPEPEQPEVEVDPQVEEEAEARFLEGLAQMDNVVDDDSMRSDGTRRSVRIPQSPTLANMQKGDYDYVFEKGVEAAEDPSKWEDIPPAKRQGLVRESQGPWPKEELVAKASQEEDLVQEVAAPDEPEIAPEEASVEASAPAPQPAPKKKAKKKKTKKAR